MKVYITGGNGFLGKNLLPLLKENNIEYYVPSSKEVDILNFEQFRNAVETYKPDAIIGLAANCGGILKNFKNPAVLVRDNTQMALNLFEVARLCNISKVYSVGSVCSYPSECPMPFKEDMIFSGASHKSNRPYGEAKKMLFTLSQAYREQFDIGGAFFVPINLYGIFDHFDLYDSHVIPAVIAKIQMAIDYDLSHIECFGTGTHYREFVAARDIASAIIKAILTNFDYPEPINLGTGKDIKISDLIYLIKDLMGYEGDIVFQNNNMDGQKGRRLDTSRAKELLDWTAQTTLTEGLLETIKWYRANKKIY